MGLPRGLGGSTINFLIGRAEGAAVALIVVAPVLAGCQGGRDTGYQQMAIIAEPPAVTSLPVLCNFVSRAAAEPILGNGITGICLTSSWAGPAENRPGESVVEALHNGKAGWSDADVLWHVPVAAIWSTTKIRNLGDCDSDGVDDVLITDVTSKSEGPLPSGCGSLELRSGRDGKLLGATQASEPGKQSCCGDVASVQASASAKLIAIGLPAVTTDSSGGLVCMELRERKFEVRWRLGSLTCAQGFGEALSFIDDIDSDGWPDLVCGGAGDYLGQFKGKVTWLSGSDGTILSELAAPVEAAGFGRSVAVINDLNEDGIRDIAVGAPGAQATGNAGLSNGSLLILSGSGVEGVLRTVTGTGAGDGFGASVIPVNDYTADGVDEIAVLEVPFDPQHGRGALTIVDPTNGTKVLRVEMTSEDPRVLQLFTCGDIDDDGYIDIGIHSGLVDWMDGYLGDGISIVSGSGVEALLAAR